MPQTVHKLTLSTIKQMEQYYANHITGTPQGAVFRAKTPNAVVTAYKSGKVLFQGKSPEAEAEKWVDDNTLAISTKNNPHPKNGHIYTPPNTLFGKSHLGSDEAGTGDYFGPITVACAYVSDNQITALKQIGVQDSKNLTDQLIKQIAKDILHLDIAYSLLVLRNEKYNKLQAKGWSQGKMKAMLHHHAISKVITKVGTQAYEGIIIDQFCEPAVYKKHLAMEQATMPDNTYFMTKAESYSIAVAAASIIARASFLKEMDKLSTMLGITLPKGASNLVDEAIANIIRKNGKEVLNTCAKTHFANTSKAYKYL